jgi:hypothetical protein
VSAGYVPFFHVGILVRDIGTRLEYLESPMVAATLERLRAFTK